MAQTTPTLELPNSRFLYTETRPEVERAKEATTKSILTTDTVADGTLDFNAPEINFDRDSNIAQGKGGVVISGNGMQVQADEGSLNMTTQDVTASGDVIIADPSGRVRADQIEFNMETETGKLCRSRFLIEEGGFLVNADQAQKLSEIEYELTDATLTTCQCEDGSPSWYLATDECNITQEGYAHTYGTTFRFFDVPVFYTPYFGFPVKTERTSGLLIPDLGYSSRHGFLARIPLFVVLDDQTDMTFRPFIESRTRRGTGLDFRKAFSRYHSINSRFIYSDESPRGDDLQGTIVDNIYDAVNDPTPWDEDRFGGYYNHIWRTKGGGDIDASIIADVRYISDDLFLREIEDSEIGDRQSRYTTSIVATSVALGDLAQLDVRGEYNQSIEVDDDIVLQRLPEARLSTTRTFRPFGFNPFGLKVVSRLNATTTDFAREEGYDGWRSDIAPSFTIPFHYKNYFASAFSIGLNQTYYNLDNREVLGTDTKLDGSYERTVPQFGYTTSTTVERVFDVPRGSVLADLTSLGRKNQDLELRRVKHQIEPYVTYSYVPDTSQAELPLFDAFDRIRSRSLVTYGISTSLLGRFLPAGGTAPIPELTPEIPALPEIGIDQPLTEFGGTDSLAIPTVSLREGEIRRLLGLNVRQSYDYVEDDKDLDPGRRPHSDIAADLILYPTNDFALSFGTNYDPYDRQLSSWSMLTNLKTDRGDALRARFSYVRDSISQVEGNVELVLFRNAKIGYYARYDDRDAEVIEQRYGLRFGGDCACWYVDVGVSDTINPDKQSFLVSFTFSGLGTVTQDVLLAREDTTGSP